VQEITTVGVDFAKSVFTTKDEVAKLDGFDKAFTQADRNKDVRFFARNFARERRQAIRDQAVAWGDGNQYQHCRGTRGYLW